MNPDSFNPGKLRAAAASGSDLTALVAFPDITSAPRAFVEIRDAWTRCQGGQAELFGGRIEQCAPQPLGGLGQRLPEGCTPEGPDGRLFGDPCPVVRPAEREQPAQAELVPAVNYSGKGAKAPVI